MDRDIISHETLLAFARVGAKVMGEGFGLRYFFLRTEMSAAGIETTEILESTWAVGHKESLETVDRFQGYYDTIDWRNRDDVRRMVPVFEKIISAVLDHHERSFLADIADHLEKDGLRVNQAGKICRKETDDAAKGDIY